MTVQTVPLSFCSKKYINFEINANHQMGKYFYFCHYHQQTIAIAFSDNAYTQALAIARVIESDCQLTKVCG